MIDTGRLILRPWEDRDRAPFAAMGADPEVMATLGPLMSRVESDALVDRLLAMQARDGHCFWAIERKADHAFLGFAGATVGEVGPIIGDLELGWRLARHAWGCGYATEAASASADWCAAHRPARRVAAITAVVNDRSRAVMARIGMHHRPELDFDHPNVPKGDRLCRHVTYVLGKQER